MSRKVIVISGSIASGKSKLAKRLEKDFDAFIVKTRDALITRAAPTNPAIKTTNGRLSLQEIGDHFDETTDGKWVRDLLSEAMRKTKQPIFVVDSVRTKKQIDEIRKSFGPLTHLHLTAPPEELRNRYYRRFKRKGKAPTYDEARKNRTESNIESLARVADVIIDTYRSSEEDVSVRAASRMSLYGRNETGYVDVIVGGQFGSEGKGQVAAYLSREYDLLVRVGGPNAGHKVPEEPKSYTHHHLPSGTRRSDAKILLGPGMVINVEHLQKEISDCDVDYERLSIDPYAMIIEKNDIEIERKTLVNTIGSTGQGVGQATARKVSRSNGVRLARDIPELKPYIRPAIGILENAIANNGRVLLEGTQGTGLSIHHGFYPYVTSRETTISGCLADAGIPPRLVRRVIMVSRTYPIRVESPKGGTSGPISQEISLKEIAERSGKVLAELENTEKTSTTNKKRRIGEFDWDLIKKAAFLNGTTDIALTFTDYISAKNESARRFEQLTPETIKMIEEIEQVTKAKVSLIATGFSARSIIDRRRW